MSLREVNKSPQRRLLDQRLTQSVSDFLSGFPGVVDQGKKYNIWDENVVKILTMRFCWEARVLWSLHPETIHKVGCHGLLFRSRC